MKLEETEVQKTGLNFNMAFTTAKKGGSQLAACLGTFNKEFCFLGQFLPCLFN